MANLTPSIIAVTGLAGHAIGSWRSPTGSDVWIRDFLPDDEVIDKCRILTFGYNSDLLDSTNDSSIKDYARRLLTDVQATRQQESVYASELS